MTNKNPKPIVDHLFRHQYGKMVAILTRLFGLQNLELIEDAVQDTFLRASLKWRTSQPDNPEAWLTQAAKNRAIDLFRQINAQKERQKNLHADALMAVPHGSVSKEMNEYFLDHEVEDSQLRMIFVACHPAFAKEEQIAFALKSISGFSMKEIAVALLQKEDSIKKRLQRTRKKILDQDIKLDYPDPAEVEERIAGVMQIIYLIFNEGFHSTKENSMISKDLCGEAIRLCRLLLKKKSFRSGSLYALFAILCYHSARLESKQGEEIAIDLKQQDRSKWYRPLIVLGNDALTKTLDYEDRSIYHLEASIAAEHVRAIKFENTNWKRILDLYDEMLKLQTSDSILLAKANIYLEIDDLRSAKKLLDGIDPSSLSQRAYLYHGSWAGYFEKSGDTKKAKMEYDQAIELCTNLFEKNYLIKKRKNLSS